MRIRFTLPSWQEMGRGVDQAFNGSGPLAQLAGLHLALDSLQDLETALIATARQDGHPWDAIAAVLNLDVPDAIERFVAGVAREAKLRPGFDGAAVMGLI